MGKLTDWVEEKSVLVESKFDENDITTNERIRNIFFEQVENLEFDVESRTQHYGKNFSEYTLAFRLDFPRKKEMPYKFFFDADKKLLIPQYTKTHRVYKAPFGSTEAVTLEHLAMYLEQNPDNNTSYNPKNKRERGLEYAYKTLVEYDDEYSIELTKDEWNQYNGNIVLKASNNELIAYQDGKDNFVVTPDFKDVRVIVKFFDEYKYGNRDTDRKEEQKQFYQIMVYNVPEDFDLDIHLECKY